MLVEFIVFFIGLFILIKGADLLVDNSARLARTLGISSSIVGLTIVAYGTSLPEFAVSIVATIEDSRGIVLGNVVGSNIVNIGLIIGASALIRSLGVEWRIFKGSVIFMLVFSFLTLVVAKNNISRIEGSLILAIFIFFLYHYYKTADIDSKNENINNAGRKSKIVAGIIAGILGVGLGSKLLVDSAVKIALYFGISEEVIGASLVAFGTSLPEIVTSVVAAYKGFSGISLGNIVGSNIFNIGLVLGSCAFIKPLIVKNEFFFDIYYMIAVTIALTLFMMSGSIGRIKGALLLSFYIGYIYYLFS